MHLTQSTQNVVGERTFFIGTRACQPQPIQPCQVCRQQHRIWQCKVFKQEGVSERWNIAERWKIRALENHAKELDNVVKMAIINCTIDCSIYIKTPVGRQFLKQNQKPGHAAPNYNMNTRDRKLPPQLTLFSALRGRDTQNNVRIQTLWAHT